ncbi:MAG: class I SAM-dependent methyltransferase [Actinomycetota bacterium]
MTTKTEPRTVAQLLDLATRLLADSTHIFEDHDHEREAQELLAFALKTPPAKLKRRMVVASATRARFLSLVARRAGGEPLPFLLGAITFYGLELKVRPGAFVPRPSSELTVERALDRLAGRRAPKVVDLCAGAGPIALAIAYERPGAEVWAADISDEGLAQARSNARRLGIANVRFRVGDMYDPLPAELRERVHLVVAHVPYVPPDEFDDLPAEVREFEPAFTLMGDTGDGFDLMRRTITESVEWLVPGGWLLLEVAEDLAPKVRRLVRAARLEDHGLGEDDDGLSVVVEARKPPD